MSFLVIRGVTYVHCHKFDVVSFIMVHVPGPDSVGIFAISQSCSGVAARACGLVSLEPTKIVEILKDRTSWFQDCRNL
ncbi:hypothetical protein HanRHA438_Chr04g0166121 [Helianthus annuus]|uniref:Uncharacterized protein n=1 Tax=Helianthus annuus TaxID=4232 RepID=A0A9K3J6I4_HELAN|nr:hypothetical protein HanXRQr2_Chr04g0155971 [Helianthus annuus]KAJ0580347.1 putative class III homeodomain-leucine zipper family [Helianthus annuus]KAJ0596295.1 putative class III homeodomain-leucine zipper family [Helianthus annuus]KAJ0926008.1 hypothetical protein HanRHA438_Chr04g0166121 [Helianthus annuus]KAJ0930496.1 hypothetical protein HanPSC8_Chr04g0149981 [Helianthus annuus]